MATLLTKGMTGTVSKSSTGKNRRASSDRTKWWVAAERVIPQAHFDKSLSILFFFLLCHLSSLRGGRGSVLRIDWSATSIVCSHHVCACVCVCVCVCVCEIRRVCEATEAIKKRVIKRLCWLVEISSRTTLIMRSFITFLTSLLVTSLPSQIPPLEGPKVTVFWRSE